MGELQEIYSSADHVVFQSSIVRDLFNDDVKRHSSIILNPVGVKYERIKGGAHRIVTAGRLNKQKNHAMLIRAFAEFHKTHKEYTLSIYGDGELSEKIKTLIDQLGLSACVFLEGNTTELHQAIKDAEIFVLSSDYEGLSNALMEAMMMGFPCISTAIEGSTDIINDGVNGLLVPVGDDAALCAAMSRLADDPEFAEVLGRQAKNDAMAFREDAVIPLWEALVV